MTTPTRGDNLRALQYLQRHKGMPTAHLISLVLAEAKERHAIIAESNNVGADMGATAVTVARVAAAIRSEE